MKKVLFFIFAMAVVVLSCKRISMEAVEPEKEAQGTRQQLEIVPNSIQIADQAAFYGFYTSEDQWGKCSILSPNTIRISQTNYVRKLTEEEKNKIGDSISFRIELYAAYDEWDRNANSWYFKLPKGTSITKDTDFKSIGRFPLIIYTTPYFYYKDRFNHITYQRNISAYAQDLRDPKSDIYIQYEVGANPQKYKTDSIPYCDQPGFKADLFIDTKDAGTIANQEKDIYVPLISRNLQKGEEKLSFSFELKEDLENGYILYTSSGHGDLEEARTRQHSLSLDDKVVSNFDSKISCKPYDYYDKINPHGRICPTCTWRYPTRNWCQGGEIVPRRINIGNLSKGQHTLLLNVEKLTGELEITGVNRVAELKGYLSTNMVIIGSKKN
ncbi:peptide-N-glycosidase F-related protein [Sphingobacterium sp.]|uniref:peptide-N-glycosidase F-related protein n=1 Tax=Sphingobacterium sp. TaxID=341027 RepID=UPI0031DB33EA